MKKLIPIFSILAALLLLAACAPKAPVAEYT
jgi:predicted small lipoprotein YifL